MVYPVCTPMQLTIKSPTKRKLAVAGAYLFLVLVILASVRELVADQLAGARIGKRFQVCKPEGTGTHRGGAYFFSVGLEFQKTKPARGGFCA